MDKRFRTLAGTILVVLASTAAAEPLRLSAVQLEKYPAAQARQGVAVDATSFFAINNTAIGRYSRTGGKPVVDWRLVGAPVLSHINSCVVTSSRELLCAHSNFPELPMTGSLEWFDPASLQHIRSRSLGVTNGSLVWVDELASGWIAAFAHYDGRGGMPGIGHRHTRIVRLDRDFREIEGWVLPDSVLERLSPHSASGGTIGSDGYLYLTGHDRPEVYVVAPPTMGPKLIHIATVDIDTAGQAIAWDRTTDRRILWSVDRPSRQARAFEVPAIGIAEEVAHFAPPGRMVHPR